MDWVWRGTIQIKHWWILFTVREDGGYRFCNKIHLKVAESKVFSAFFQRGNFCHFYYFKKMQKKEKLQRPQGKTITKVSGRTFCINRASKWRVNIMQWQMYITVKVYRKMPHLKRNFFNGQSKSFRVQENLWCKN